MSMEPRPSHNALAGCSVDGPTAAIAAETEARAVGHAMLQAMTEQGNPLPASGLEYR